MTEKNAFRVCLVLPEQNPHSLCFREVGLLLVSALQSNGFDCDLAFNQLHQERTNIILGYHLMTFDESLKNIRYIPYQLEQLHSKEFPFSGNMESILRFATDVWDYSEKNIAFLADRDIRAKHLVPGYHQNLELIKSLPIEKRNIDILFYGSVGDRRKKILDELDSLCKVKVLFGVYGEKRDKWISRSKIVLNLHHYSLQIFEAVRISYLFNNRAFVVSEDSANYCYDKVNLPMVPYESLVATCMAFLQKYEEIESIGQGNYDDFKKNYPMTELIKNVLTDEPDEA